jgi:hypothetical protein
VFAQAADGKYLVGLGALFAWRNEPAWGPMYVVSTIAGDRLAGLLSLAGVSFFEKLRIARGSDGFLAGKSATE